MKKEVSSLAVFGGKPTFASPLPVGQMNFPEWERFESAFRGIFSRRYYTNHGPLVQELEARLCELLGVQHVICMTNATIALMIAAKALELHGKVIVPAFTFAATIQSLTWAGLEPIFCDVDPSTHHITPQLVQPLLADSVSAVLGVHLWGNVCDVEGLRQITSKRNVRLYFDAAHAFGCTYNNTPVGGLGDLEIFSFHATKVVNAGEGGCVSTNNDSLADRLRNIRSSYGVRDTVFPDIMTGNGRMSEAQAALALLSLEDYEKNRQMNRERFEQYAALLGPLPGFRFIFPNPHEKSNHQYIVAEVDPQDFGVTRDELVYILQAENILCRKYFKPGLHRCPPYNEKYPGFLNSLPVTDSLCARIIQFPSGQLITVEDIHTIGNLIIYIHQHASDIRERLRQVK